MIRNRVYGLELSGLKLNLIERFKERFNAMMVQLPLSYGIRV